jgi:hypothetical protein
MGTRGYELQAPAEFAIRWIRHQLTSGTTSAVQDSGVATEGLARTDWRTIPPVRYPHNVERITRWSQPMPDTITFRDSIYQRQKLHTLGEERYRFMGGQNGCVVEVVTLRKPASLSSRIGLFLLPMLSMRSPAKERILFSEIEKDFRSSR